MLCEDFIFKVGRDSSVGIATRLLAVLSRALTHVEAKFFAPVQTGPGTQKSSYIMGTESLCRRKGDWGVALTNHSHLRSRLKREESYTSTPAPCLHGSL